MGCNDDRLKISNQPRWVNPIRRIMRWNDPDTGPVLIDPTISQQLLVGDATYASGRPGWRGAIYNATSPAVVARRSAILILAEGGPLQVRWVHPSESELVLLQLAPAARTLIANDTNVTPMISASGEKGSTSVVTGVGTLKRGTGWSGAVVVGDLDAAALTAGWTLTVTGGTNEWQPGFYVDLEGGECLLFCGAADNTSINHKAEVWEFKEWTGA